MDVKEPVIARAVAIAGVAHATASGTSMSPFIRPGARLWIERCDAADVRRGDVVAFADGSNNVVLHRVARRVRGSLDVQGDAQTDATRIAVERVFGRVQGIALGRSQWRRAPRPLARWVGRVVLAVAPLARVTRRVIGRAPQEST